MKSLVGSVVPKRTAGAIDAAGERGLGDDPAIPDRLDQFILADNALAVAHQVNDEIEDLRLDVNGLAKPASSCWLRSISNSANRYFITTSANPARGSATDQAVQRLQI